MATNEHIGSSFDDFLEEDGILDECAEAAAKRIFSGNPPDKTGRHKRLFLSS